MIISIEEQLDILI